MAMCHLSRRIDEQTSRLPSLAGIHLAAPTWIGLARDRSDSKNAPGNRVTWFN